MSDSADASAWVRKAEHDLMAVDAISAGDDPPWDIVVFHAQQAAEKFLKALLVSHRQQPPKIHDLTRLLTICRGHASELASFADDFVFLSPLAALRATNRIPRAKMLSVFPMTVVLPEPVAIL